MLLPEDVGLPPSSKPPTEETTPEPYSPDEPNNVDDTDEPVGRPEDGRPKLSRDTEKRKQKRVLPLRKVGIDFVNLALWANDAQKTISDILNPALLSYYQKKNLRSLTKKEQAELEYIKLGVLCNIDPYSEVTADIVNDILLNNGTVISEIIDTRNLLSKDFVDKNDRQPTIDEMRQIQSSAYAFQHAR